MNTLKNIFKNNNIFCVRKFVCEFANDLMRQNVRLNKKSVEKLEKLGISTNFLFEQQKVEISQAQAMLIAWNIAKLGEIGLLDYKLTNGGKSTDYKLKIKCKYLFPNRLQAFVSNLISLEII